MTHPHRRQPRADRLIGVDRINDPGRLTAEHIVGPADQLAREMARKWGEDRVADLVSPETAARFGSQREKFERALAAEPVDVEEVRAQTERMIRAWKAVDAEAERLGRHPAIAEAWEFLGEDGKPCAIVRDAATWRLYADRHPERRLFTLEEAGRLLTSPHLRLVSAAKDAIPGATVKTVKPARTPLGDFLDDEVPFMREDRA